MTETDLLARFRMDLMHRLAARERAPTARPLPISPWVAMSLLQKAIRRGRTELALGAAATLNQDAPERLWRRIASTAFEDIGLADLPAVGLVWTALTGNRFRDVLGGGWQVASLLVEIMCQARKSRASDDLFMTIAALPVLATTRQDLASLPDNALRKVVLGQNCLHSRALALLYLFGTDRPGGTLARRRGSPARAFELLAHMGVAPTTLELCRMGYRKTGEALPPLVALLSLENGLRRDPVDDPMPVEAMAGPVPGWALDMFTREGKQALTRLLATGAGSAAFATEYLPPAKRVRFLGHVLFRVEGGALARRVGGDLSDRLRSQLMYKTLGIEPARAVVALDLMRDDLPLLNRIRASIMRGQRHEV